MATLETLRETITVVKGVTLTLTKLEAETLSIVLSRVKGYKQYSKYGFIKGILDGLKKDDHLPNEVYWKDEIVGDITFLNWHDL